MIFKKDNDLSKNDILKKLKPSAGFLKDLQLSIFVMSIAGCGLIYQYLLASYSGRVLGSLEFTLFSIMTLMILFMGIGSFFVQKFENKFLAFSILESLIALVAISSLFFISGTYALSNMLPQIISETFGIPLDYAPKHGIVEDIQYWLTKSSYFMACILGFLLGMEIPFLAAIREEIHKNKDLKNNVGVIYGVDYFGGAIGAALWIFVLIRMDIADALQYVALTNIFVGFFFILFFRKYIKKVKTALSVQVITSIIIIIACNHIGEWQQTLEQTLYRDKIVYTKNTKFQKFAVTEGRNARTGESIYGLFINGKTQFSSSDEGIYHSLLVTPTLVAAAMPENVLIVGGGDGLALRNVLRTNPKSVTLIDLDPELIEFFTNPVYNDDGKQVNADFINLTEGSFSDDRVEFKFGDAFLNAKKLIAEGKRYGAIIVDLPDPSHPDLNKLYSTGFYRELNQLLENDGAISIQSSSPYSSKNAFISIGKTLKASGFHTQQYQHNVPSFNGQWGWTIGTKSLPLAKARIASYKSLPTEEQWLTKSKLLSTFEFGKFYYSNIDSIDVNTIDNNVTYGYYESAWQELSLTAFQ